MRFIVVHANGFSHGPKSWDHGDVINLTCDQNSLPKWIVDGWSNGFLDRYSPELQGYVYNTRVITPEVR